jgi:glucose/arabinose dehydrogenase
MTKSMVSSWSARRGARGLGGGALVVLLASACPEPIDGDPVGVECAEDNGSITLPPGFCATVFADGLGRARHITVSPSGDVFVAIADGIDGTPGGVVALRDEDADGVADRRARFAGRGGNGIAWHDGSLYFAQNDRILRYRMPSGRLVPDQAPVVMVSGLPADGNHVAKTVVVADDGDLFVNIGSASNACQVQDRVDGSPGIDPCPELATRAGIWVFDGDTTNQTQADGWRFATGVRNANAMALDPFGALWAAINGRDQLFDNWPELFSEADDRRLPSEEIVRVAFDADYGWPYCYHDAVRDEKVLAPEYGGNGSVVGRCADAAAPQAVLPAHWAPLGMTFYRGQQFPARYRGGMFIANHGSRFDPQAPTPPGYNVVFIPASFSAVRGAYERFAEGFAGDGRPLPQEAEHRPVGLAEAPDGSLYITDDHGGRIWRVFYQGT